MDVLGQDGNRLYRAPGVINTIQKWTSTMNSALRRPDEDTNSIDTDAVRGWAIDENMPVVQTARERKDKIVDTIQCVIEGAEECVTSEEVLKLSAEDPIEDALKRVRYRPSLKRFHVYKNWLKEFDDSAPENDELPAGLLSELKDLFQESEASLSKELELLEDVGGGLPLDNNTSVNSTTAKGQPACPAPVFDYTPYVSLLNTQSTGDILDAEIFAKKTNKGAPGRGRGRGRGTKRMLSDGNPHKLGEQTENTAAPTPAKRGRGRGRGRGALSRGGQSNSIVTGNITAEYAPEESEPSAKTSTRGRGTGTGRGRGRGRGRGGAHGQKADALKPKFSVENFIKNPRKPRTAAQKTVTEVPDKKAATSKTPAKRGRSKQKKNKLESEVRHITRAVMARM